MRRRAANGLMLPPAPAFASPPQPVQVEGPREQAMNLLKRMRPDELMAIGEAATALAKRKLEDRKKVCVFAAVVCVRLFFQHVVESRPRSAEILCVCCGLQQVRTRTLLYLVR